MQCSYIADRFFGSRNGGPKLRRVSFSIQEIPNPQLNLIMFHFLELRHNRLTVKKRIMYC